MEIGRDMQGCGPKPYLATHHHDLGDVTLRLFGCHAQAHLFSDLSSGMGAATIEVVRRRGQGAAVFTPPQRPLSEVTAT